MRLIVVVGARPNFIKVGPLMPAFAEAGIDAQLAHTGQHYDSVMSDVFFRDLALVEPTWFLGVGSGSHAVQTGTAMIKLEDLFLAERPDAVFVVGDVNSTLSAALAASKVHIPVVHLEAGLRSRDMSMPEEVNRVLTDRISAQLLTTVEEAERNLRAEGVDASRIHFTGNVMAESLLRTLPLIAERRVAARHAVGDSDYVLATIHRPENTDSPDKLQGIAAALLDSPLPVLFPAHPRTRPLLASVGIDGASHVHLVDPVGYLDMIALQRDASAVLTDSGGMQEEACMLGTPCVTVRRNTERAITIDLGANELASADEVSVSGALARALEKSRDSWERPPLWDERVSSRVVESLQRGVIPMEGER